VITFLFKNHGNFCETIKIVFFYNIWGKWSEPEPELEVEPELKFFEKWEPEPEPHKNRPAPQH
jgi:hypothetical protein